MGYKHLRAVLLYRHKAEILVCTVQVTQNRKTVFICNIFSCTFHKKQQAVIVIIRHIVNRKIGIPARIISALPRKYGGYALKTGGQVL